MHLAEAERLSHTGSFGWNASTGEIYWSDGAYRIYECEPTTKPTVELVIDRIHPDDRMPLRQILDRAAKEGCDFIAEHRLLMADGSVKHVQAAAHRLIGEAPEHLVFVGAVTDITERKHAEDERERLRQLEADLAHINRVSMMGELAASLAHEIKQPMAAAVMAANACMRWLRRDPPDQREARGAASAVVAAVTRAAGIIDRVRSLYGQGTPQREVVDLNEILREMTVLLGDTADRHSISIRTELDLGLPRTTADRVQLQQVLMNLMLNGIEAMQETGGELTIASKRIEDGQLSISVSDAGIGLPADEAGRMFDAFFTTKPHGTGMGLSISRRIIESHGGRLWAIPNGGLGATFQFTLPGG
jgi:signal transduction histidine kinase